MRLTERRLRKRLGVTISTLLLVCWGCDLLQLFLPVNGTDSGKPVSAGNEETQPAPGEPDVPSGAPARTNAPPVVEAFTNRTPAASGDTVQINASRSVDPDGDPLTFAWEQTGGEPVVTLSDSATAVASFVAPEVANYTTLIFTATVSDGADTDTGVVNVTVMKTIPVGSPPPGVVLGDNTPPQITSITSASADSPPEYGIGAAIDITVNFSEPITLAGGTLDVTLDTGAVVSIAPFGPANTASAVYIVQAGENSADVDAVGVVLGAGATLTDLAGNAGAIALPPGATIANLKDIVVDGDTPTLDAAASRKTHGGAGDFDLIMSLDGADPTSESRRDGLQRLVLTFSEDIRATDGTPDASEVNVTPGSVNTVTIIGSQMEITFTGITDQSCANVVITGVEDFAGNALLGDNDVRVRVLAGDLTGPYGLVDLTDFSLSKSKQGTLLTPATAGLDVSLDGVIDLTDASLIKSIRGNNVACP